MPAHDQGQIVTFYSYKGGSGRTMALANVGWILAANGYRVLVVDWDLEAPGLPKFFRPFLDDAVVARTPGVLHLINRFALESAGQGEPVGARDVAWYDSYAELDGHFVPVQWDFGDGRLDLLPAGRQNRDYAHVSGFDWSQFFERLDGRAFFDALRHSFKSAYDYVLIDSRTGMSDVGDICTVVLPDTVVNCFTMSEQSIDGATMMVQRIAEHFSERAIRILPVPMRLDLTAEKERLDIGRATAQAKFDRYLTDLQGEELERYWRNVEVPYQAYYSYEEILAVFADPADAPNTVLSSFERITSAITDGWVTCLPPMPDDLRRQHLSEFQRQPPAPRADVYLSYVPEDRAWADWLRVLLDDAGYRVTSRPAGGDHMAETLVQTRDSLRSSSKIAVVLSSAYLQSAEYDAVRQAVKTLDPIGNRRLVVPISVGGPAFTNPFPIRSTADLDQLDEEAARRTVLRVLDGTVSSPARPAGRADRPRYPRSRPEVRSLMPARNPAFTGRTAILDQLREDLRLGGTETPIQVLHGLGGVGKTQIALEYAYRFISDYDVIWWVPSEDFALAQQRLAELGGPLRVQTADAEETVRAVVQRLERGEPYRRALVIFDNVEATRRDEVLPLLPQAGAAHVLITTHDRNLATAAPGMKAVDVSAFTRAESVEHLRRQVPALTVDECDRLAETVGDLPLFVAMAAAWLKETAIPVASYIDQLRHQPEVVLSESLEDYPRTVSAVWNATIDQLRTRSPAAVRLLELCAFFGPEPISTSLIYSRAFVSAHRQVDPVLGGEQLMRLVRDLGRFALARVDFVDRSIQVHRLLQALVKNSLPPEDQEQLKRTVRQILAAMRPTDKSPDDPTTWTDYEILWPHLYACESDKAGPDESESRQLMVDRVRFLAQRGQLDSALELSERLWKSWAAPQPPDDVWHLQVGYELANILRQQGEAARALEIHNDVYERQYQHPNMGPDHVHTLRSAGIISADLRFLGRWQEALEKDELTHRALTREYGPDYDWTLRAANNLAVSLRLNGRCFAARDLDTSVYARLRDTLGPEHSFTVLSATNLARDLRDCGLFIDARRILGVTIDLCQDSFGEDAPLTLNATLGLAVAERRAGRHADARERARRVYEQFVKVFGPDAPETLFCAMSLASDDSATGNHAAALEQGTNIYRRYTETLGERHPQTLACANNLGIYLLANGDLEAATERAEKTQARMIEVLGEEHPYTLSCAVNIGNVLATMGNRTEALRLTATTLEALTRTLGEDHPDTLTCSANRVIILREAGHRDEADQLAHETVLLMAQTFGESHPSTLSLREGHLLSCDLEPHQL
jgi:cellulose biosynthesis protein BcsQ